MIGSKERILIVDDNVGTRRSLGLILGDMGYHTEAVGTGRKALEKAQETYFDVAFLDINLPDARGIDLIALLKKLQPDMAVIMITAYASVETAVRALNDGASGYIIKPSNMDEVLAILEKVLEKKHLLEKKGRLHREAQLQVAQRRHAE